MSWLFSQALGEAFSAGTSLDGEQFAQLNVMPTPHKFWRNDKTMDASDLSRFGLTLRLLTDDRGQELLMSYLAAFPARTSVAQEKALDSTGSAAAYGQKWPALLARYDPYTHSLKTAQCSLLEDSTASFATLPRWGSMRSGELLEQMPLEHYIGASACGSLLPTPSGCRSGKNHVVGRLDEWGGSSNLWRGTETGKTSSPSFEEWVMGWPVQWTGLTPFETARFREWQQQHGGF